MPWRETEGWQRCDLNMGITVSQPFLDQQYSPLGQAPRLEVGLGCVCVGKLASKKTCAFRKQSLLF